MNWAANTRVPYHPHTEINLFIKSAHYHAHDGANFDEVPLRRRKQFALAAESVRIGMRVSIT